MTWNIGDISKCLKSVIHSYSNAWPLDDAGGIKIMRNHSTLHYISVTLASTYFQANTRHLIKYWPVMSRRSCYGNATIADSLTKTLARGQFTWVMSVYIVKQVLEPCMASLATNPIGNTSMQSRRKQGSSLCGNVC